MTLLLATILPSILIILFFVNSDKFKEPKSQIIKTEMITPNIFPNEIKPT